MLTTKVSLIYILVLLIINNLPLQTKSNILKDQQVTEVEKKNVRGDGENNTNIDIDENINSDDSQENINNDDDDDDTNEQIQYDCSPQGIYINFGNYYSASIKKKLNVQYQVIFYTRSICQEVFSLKYGMQDENSQDGENQQSQKILNEYVTNNVQGIKAYYHYFYITDLKKEDYGKLLQYQIFYKQQQNQTELQETKKYNFIFRNHQNTLSQEQEQINNEKKKFKIIFFGDFDTSDKISEYTINSLKQITQNKEMLQDYYALIHTGDMAYDMIDDQGEVGLKYMNDISDIFSSLPYVTIAGNHEERNQQSVDYFQMTFPNVMRNQKLYYSWQAQNIHFLGIFLHTKVYSEDSAYMQEQLKFIEGDLKYANTEKNRKERPWIVVYTHQPFYCSFDFPSTEQGGNIRRDCKNARDMELVQKVEKLLIQYKVNLVLESHVHQQERSYPVKNDEVYNQQSKQQYKDYDQFQQFDKSSPPVYILEGVPGNSHFLKEQDYKLEKFTALKGSLAGFQSDIVQTGYGIISSDSNDYLKYEHYNTVQQKVTDTFLIVEAKSNYNHDKYDQNGGIEKDDDFQISDAILILLFILFFAVLTIVFYVFIRKRMLKRSRQQFVSTEQNSQSSDILNDSTLENKTSNIKFELPDLDENQ